MILAVLDDLMFSSKIRTAAAPLGVEVVFARSKQAALTALRESSPSLVILDLNSRQVDPLGVVTEMMANPTLAPTVTVGFVSHVDTSLIQAARTAGVTEVMARSAFTQHLPELLARDRKA